MAFFLNWIILLNANSHQMDIAQYIDADLQRAELESEKVG